MRVFLSSFFSAEDGYAVSVTAELHAGAQVMLPPLLNAEVVDGAGELQGPAEHPWVSCSGTSLAHVMVSGCWV